MMVSSNPRRTGRLFLAEPSPGIGRQVDAWVQSAANELGLQVFATARQLLRRMEYEQPDLLLLDVTLPQFDALTAVRSLEASRTPVVLLSPDTRDGARLTMDALLVGACDYIIKRRRRGEVHLAISRRRFLALAQRHAAPSHGPADRELPHWTRLWPAAHGTLRRNPERNPFSADGRGLGVATCRPSQLAALITALSAAPDVGAGAMCLAVPQARRFSQALREAAARRWNRPVLLLRDGERLRPGQWRLLPGRMLLAPTLERGGMTGGHAAPPGECEGQPVLFLRHNRLVDAERALEMQLDFLRPLPAGSLRVYLAEEPCGAVRRAAAELAAAGHALLVAPGSRRGSRLGAFGAEPVAPASRAALEWLP